VGAREGERWGVQARTRRVQGPAVPPGSAKRGRGRHHGALTPRLTQCVCACAGACGRRCWGASRTRWRPSSAPPRPRSWRPRRCARTWSGSPPARRPLGSRCGRAGRGYGGSRPREGERGRSGREWAGADGRRAWGGERGDGRRLLRSAWAWQPLPSVLLGPAVCAPGCRPRRGARSSKSCARSTCAFGTTWTPSATRTTSCRRVMTNRSWVPYLGAVARRLLWIQWVATRGAVPLRQVLCAYVVPQDKHAELTEWSAKRVQQLSTSLEEAEAEADTQRRIADSRMPPEVGRRWVRTRALSATTLSHVPPPGRPGSGALMIALFVVLRRPLRSSNTTWHAPRQSSRPHKCARCAEHTQHMSWLLPPTPVMPRTPLASTHIEALARTEPARNSCCAHAPCRHRPACATWKRSTPSWPRGWT
jgi:hypothetical protein